MESSKSERITSAFKLGYISAILENELNDLESSNLTANENDISFYLNSFLLFQDDYECVFKEPLITFPRFRHSTDIVEYLTANISFIKDKVSEIDEAELELAYFIGGTLALSFEDNLGVFSEETFKSTLALVMNLCKKPFQEIEDLVEKIFSNNFYECMIARNAICSKFIGDNISDSQRSAFLYLDKIVVNKY